MADADTNPANTDSANTGINTDTPMLTYEFLVDQHVIPDAEFICSCMGAVERVLCQSYPLLACVTDTALQSVIKLGVFGWTCSVYSVDVIPAEDLSKSFRLPATSLLRVHELLDQHSTAIRIELVKKLLPRVSARSKSGPKFGGSKGDDKKEVGGEGRPVKRRKTNVNTQVQATLRDKSNAEATCRKSRKNKAQNEHKVKVNKAAEPGDLRALEHPTDENNAPSIDQMDVSTPQKGVGGADKAHIPSGLGKNGSSINNNSPMLHSAIPPHPLLQDKAAPTSATLCVFLTSPTEDVAIPDKSGEALSLAEEGSTSPLVEASCVGPSPTRETHRGCHPRDKSQDVCDSSISQAKGYRGWIKASDGHAAVNTKPVSRKRKWTGDEEILHAAYRAGPSTPDTSPSHQLPLMLSPITLDRAYKSQRTKSSATGRAPRAIAPPVVNLPDMDQLHYNYNVVTRKIKSTPASSGRSALHVLHNRAAMLPTQASASDCGATVSRTNPLAPSPDGTHAGAAGASPTQPASREDTADTALHYAQAIAALVHKHHPHGVTDVQLKLRLWELDTELAFLWNFAGGVKDTHSAAMVYVPEMRSEAWARRIMDDRVFMMLKGVERYIQASAGERS